MTGRKVAGDQDGTAGSERRALVQRAQRGDDAAFEALYRERAEAVFRFTLSMLRNSAAAEDAAAETFLQAWRSLPKLRDASKFDSWLFRIAQHTALREIKRPRNVELNDLNEPDDPDRWTRPEMVADTQAGILAVREALLELPDEYREVLVLRYYAELSHAEVARQLGKTEQHTRVLQFRALKRLRGLLAESGVVAPAIAVAEG